jgi:hypothetical protein
MVADGKEIPGVRQIKPPGEAQMQEEDWQKVLVTVRRFVQSIITNPAKRVQAIVLIITLLFLGVSCLFVQERLEVTKWDRMECMFKGNFGFIKPGRPHLPRLIT